MTPEEALNRTMNNVSKTLGRTRGSAENAQDAAEHEVNGARQGTDHNVTTAGQARDSERVDSTPRTTSSEQTVRKSSHDNRLVSGDAAANDPGKGMLREDELD